MDGLLLSLESRMWLFSIRIGGGGIVMTKGKVWKGLTKNSDLIVAVETSFVHMTGYGVNQIVQRNI